MEETRIETLIEALIDDETVETAPQSRIETYILAFINRDKSMMPQPESRFESLWLALYEHIFERTDPELYPSLSRIEAILASIISGEEYTGLTASRIESLFVQLAEKYRGVLVTVTGNPVVLEANVGDQVESLTVFGKTVVWNQLATPSNPFTARNGVTATYNQDNLSTVINGTATGSFNASGWWKLATTSNSGLVSGHYYLASTIVLGGSYSGTATFGGQASSLMAPIGESKIFKLTTQTGNISNFFASYDTVFDNLELSIIWIDLTAIYGSDNEPTNVGDERIKRLLAYAEKHPEYNPGQLISVNQNLATILAGYELGSSGELIENAGYYSTDYIDISDKDVTITGTYDDWYCWYDSDKSFISATFTYTKPDNATYLRINGWGNGSDLSVNYGVSVTVSGKNLVVPYRGTIQTSGSVGTFVNPDGSISLSGTATGNGSKKSTDFFTVEAGTYTFSVFYISGLAPLSRLYFEDGTIATNVRETSPSSTVELAAGRYYASYYRTNGYNYDGTSLAFQLERGTEATDWEPYVKPTTHLIEVDELRGIPGTDVQDELTLTGTVGKVGVVDLGTLMWSLYSSNGTFAANVPTLAANATSIERNKGLTCSEYQPDSNVSLTSMTDKTMLRNHKVLFIRDTDYTDSASFKAAMQGVMLYYELAEPIVHDITPVTIPLPQGVTPIVSADAEIKPTLTVGYLADIDSAEAAIEAEYTALLNELEG